MRCLDNKLVPEIWEVTKEELLSGVTMRGRLADIPNDSAKRRGTIVGERKDGSRRRHTSEALIHASAMDLVIFAQHLRIHSNRQPTTSK
ncbi:hypothetical protein B0H12DRAFT_1142244 [Mycena haematopus]|nr:hypothetical protein B0H12DRAFT_1142244 [Mycena haematopus]